jgi:GntR family transcriptional regulator/MocR family aminotransferase
MASSDANGMVIYLEKLGQSISKFSNRICSSPENLISEAKNYCAGPPRRFNTEQMLSELIYEGEIHRLLKKNILVYKQDAIFYTNVLKKILKMLSVLKNNGRLAIWLQFRYRNFLNSTFRTSATL